MNIDAPAGTKVMFKSSCEAQTRWGSNDDAALFLVAGREYTVLRTEIHSQHTKVVLEEFPTKKFNSVGFY